MLTASVSGLERGADVEQHVAVDDDPVRLRDVYGAGVVGERRLAVRQQSGPHADAVADGVTLLPLAAENVAASGPVAMTVPSLKIFAVSPLVV